MSDIFGHVYVIQGHKGVKIGMSTNPTKRVAILKRGMGIADTNVFISNPVLDHQKAESKCHKHFATKRMVGEFFDVPFLEAVELVKLLTPTPSGDEVANAEDARKIEEVRKSNVLNEYVRALLTMPKAELHSELLKATIETIDNYDLDEYIDKLKKCENNFDLLLVRNFINQDIIKMQSEMIADAIANGFLNDDLDSRDSEA